jgi:hypothetical protein
VQGVDGPNGPANWTDFERLVRRIVLHKAEIEKPWPMVKAFEHRRILFAITYWFIENLGISLGLPVEQATLMAETRRARL